MPYQAYGYRHRACCNAHGDLLYNNIYFRLDLSRGRGLDLTGQGR